MRETQDGDRQAGTTRQTYMEDDCKIGWTTETLMLYNTRKLDSERY